MAFDVRRYIKQRNRTISDASAAIVEKFHLAMVADGKRAGAEHYPRHLADFISWAEGRGYRLEEIPEGAGIDYLTEVHGDKAPATRDTARGYLRAALNRLTEMGYSIPPIDFAAQEQKYPGGKAQQARKEAKKEATRERKANARIEAVAKILPEGIPLRNVMAGVVDEGGNVVPIPPQDVAKVLPAEIVDHQIEALVDDIEEPTLDPEIEANFENSPPELLKPVEAEPLADQKIESPVVSVVEQKEEEMSDPNQTVAPANPAPPLPANQVVLTLAPPSRARGAQAQPQPLPGAFPAATGAVALNVNGIVFRGPYIAIYRVMDGMIPGTMAGQEVIIEQAVTRQIAQHGTAEAYLQRVVVPRIRSTPAAIPPGTAVLSFVLVELNAAKQPTNTRAEVTVGLTSDPMMQPHQQGGNNPYQPVFADVGGPAVQVQMPAMQPQTMSKAEELLFKRLEEDIRASREREEKAREEAKAAANLQMQMMLQTSANNEAAARRDLEAMKREIELRLSGAMNAPPSMLPPLPPPLPPQPVESTADVLRATAEAQTALVSALVSRNEAPKESAKDWLLPLMQMQQENSKQAQIQAAETQKLMMQMQQNSAQMMQQSQQLMMQMQAENQKLLLGVLTAKPEKSDSEKMMEQMMMKKLLDDEGGVEKMMKNVGAFQAMTERMGLGGGTSTVSELLANMPGILKGLASLQQAASISKVAQGSAQVQRQPAAPTQALPRAQPQVQGQAPKSAPQAQAQVQASTQPQSEVQPAQPTQGTLPIEPTVEVPASVEDANEPSEELKAAGLTLLATAKDAQESDDEAADMPFLAALQNYLGALANSGPVQQQQLQVMLKEFNEAQGWEDVYAIAKYGLLFARVPALRENVEAVAACLHRNYTVVYSAINGGAQKVLDDADDGQEEVEGNAEEVA